MSENSSKSIFSNPEVPESVKVGTAFLLLKGSYGIYTRQNEKEKTFVSQIHKKDKSRVTCMFDLQVPRESIVPMACRAIADNQLDLKNLIGYSFEELVTGSFSTHEIVEKFITANKESLYRLSDAGVTGIINESEAGIKVKIDSFIKAVREVGILPASAIAQLEEISAELGKYLSNENEMNEVVQNNNNTQTQQSEDAQGLNTEHTSK
jgi:hypothetical protein